MPKASQFRTLVCRVGMRRFALRLDLVREVHTDLPITRMPGVAAPVTGIANVRGTVGTVGSGAQLLGATSSPAADWLVVLTLRDGQVGLAVEEVEDLALLDAEGAGGGGAVPLLDVAALLRPLFPA